MLVETLVVTAINAEQLQLEKPTNKACLGCVHRLLGANRSSIFFLPRPAGREIKIGDQIRLQLPKSRYYQLISWAYAMPLLALIAGSLLAVQLPLGINQDLLAVIGAGLGLTMSQIMPLPKHLTHPNIMEAGILAINPAQSRSG